MKEIEQLFDEMDSDGNEELYPTEYINYLNKV